MLYQRSLGIEQRLDAVLKLIRQRRYSTPKIASKLGVSIPTISRDVTALRERGFDIRAEKQADGWRYVLSTCIRQDTQPRLHDRAGGLSA